ncbi:hypothetical protein [Rhodoferax antarcticus]|uniref:hypothetical protein n=1 Tax=Rhodoferax antarcticus TaxID=81479 RepID=UPI0012EC413E|nr:hypothetical protein [Rhodoferax antarcticus]
MPQLLNGASGSGLALATTTTTTTTTTRRKPLTSTVGAACMAGRKPLPVDLALVPPAAELCQRCRLTLATVTTRRKPSTSTVGAACMAGRKPLPVDLALVPPAGERCQRCRPGTGHGHHQAQAPDLDGRVQAAAG